jgi:hypothetical protein
MLTGLLAGAESAARVTISRREGAPEGAARTLARHNETQMRRPALRPRRRGKLRSLGCRNAPRERLVRVIAGIARRSRLVRRSGQARGQAHGHDV